MACKGYKFAVEWISFNDEPMVTHLTEKKDEISSLISVVLVADLFEKTPEKVAKDVLKYRGTFTHE